MAVAPEFQRTGIGSKLIADGTRRLRERGTIFVVVLGHPEYYPRFGFVPASRYGLHCQWEVPDDAFMILPLQPTELTGIAGLIKYRGEFSTVI
jgi:putative acetyltransferase